VNNTVFGDNGHLKSAVAKLKSSEGGDHKKNVGVILTKITLLFLSPQTHLSDFLY